MFAVCFLAFCTGFLSLSLEILWIRLFSFSYQMMPQAFSFVLTFFLIGVGLGAYIGKCLCKKVENLWLASGLALIASSVWDLSSPFIYADGVMKHSLMIGGFAILMTALLKAIVFPIAHHLGSSPFAARVGRNISRVYVSNIMGSTLGPLFTGVFLLSVFTTQQSFVFCATATLLIALFCLYRQLSFLTMSTAAFAMSFMFASAWTINPHELILKIATPFYGKLINLVENPFGIITIYEGGKEGDIVAGGNIYDGRTNLNPMVDSNGIHRILLMSALVDHPSQVLMIGLSIGTWLKLVTSFPNVDNIDVVEINPGYLQLIRNYPQQELGLLDPRVHIHIDDGRRWLKKYPNKKYDMIIMNTTYHWRAYCSHLLSEEFLRLLKKHMTEQAVLEFNTTNSPDALKTANAVFKQAYLYENMVLAADFDWRQKLHQPEAVKKIAELKLDGKFLYPPGSENLISSYLNKHLTVLDQIEPIYNSLGRQVEIITDDNLITEFKYGKHL